MPAKIYIKSHYLFFFCLVFVLLLLSVQSRCLWADDFVHEQNHNRSVSQQDLGRQIYRQGRSVSDAPVEAYVMGDMLVLGTQFTCLNCHGRSGMGGAEGSTFTLAINPAALSAPRKGIYLERPAYTDETLAKAIRTGAVPGNKQLSSAMPQYQLSDPDMAALLSYLKTLSSSFSPGLTEKTIHFATVISDWVDPEAARAMLAVLERYFQDKNSRTRYENIRQQHGPFYQHYRIKAYRDWVLHVWRLNGPRESWGDQLATYNKQQPVFAMVSGIVSGGWAPVHRFCEQQEIPCLLPNTDFPEVTGKNDFYTLYFSEGHRLEARGIVSALSAKQKRSTILQVYSLNSSGIFGAESLRNSAGRIQGMTVHDWVLSDEEQFTWKRLDNRVLKTAADTVVLWLTARELARVSREGRKALFSGPMYLSSSLLGGFVEDFPVIFRGYTVLHPFNSPQLQEETYKRLQVWLDRRNLASSHRRILGQSYYACMILGKGLAHIKNHFYRDYLLDALDHGNAKSIFSINYPRLSYGPGQRYLAKGVYILEKTQPQDKKPLFESTWVVPDI